MKSTSGWKDGGSGTNSSGFNVMPAGSRFYGGTFYGVGMYSGFWSFTEGDGSHAWSRLLVYYRSVVVRSNYGKDYAFSCRCVRDQIGDR